MNTTLIILFIYLALMFGVAWYFSRKESLNAYFLNSKKTSLWFMTFSTVATIVGAGGVVAIVSEVYNSGISYGLALPISFVAGMIILGLMAKKIKILFAIGLLISITIFAPSAFGLKTTNFRTNTSRTYRAVIAGIADYPGTSSDLSHPVDDVNAIELALEQGPYSIQKLTNSQVTVQNVRSKLNWLINNANDGDMSVFYYCGHGTQRDTVDAKREGDNKDECLYLYDDILRDDELTDLIAEISGEVVVLLDTCKSTGFAEDLDYIIQPDQEIAIISAHGENQNLFEIPVLERGLLTFALVRGLTTDSLNNGATTLVELYENSWSFYETSKEIFGIDYEMGLEIYPHRYSQAFSRIKNMVIIPNFNNKKPTIDKEYDIGKKSIEITATVTDPDSDKVYLNILWGDGKATRWDGPSNSGHEFTKSHEYSSSGRYTVVLVARDDKGSCSGWHQITFEIRSKSRPLNLPNLKRFEQMKNILYRIFDKMNIRGTAK